MTHIRMNAPLLALALLSLCAVMAACASYVNTSAARPDEEPPEATKKSHVHRIHGDERTDDYYWLREKQNPEVIAYLEAENAYMKAMTAHSKELEAELYDEMVARIKETDLSVPYRKGEHYYYSRTEEGLAYNIHCRKRGSLDAKEEILLDQNALAEGEDYFRLGLFRVSPSEKLLAYSVDSKGSEEYTLRFRDLETGEDLPDEVPDTYYSFAWGNDDATVFYTVLDDASRPYRLYRHVLGEAVGQDTLMYEEKDERFFVSVGKTRSEKYILLTLGSQITSEVHVLDADHPRGSFQVIHPRQQGMEYSVSHHGDRFFIVTNDGAINFKLVEAPTANPSKEHWKEVLAHREDVMVVGVDAFRDHLVVYEREHGLPQFRIRNLATGDEYRVEFPEAAYSARSSQNHEFDTATLRFSYTSLITPDSVFDYDMSSRERVLKKQTEVLGGYDPAIYTTERVSATASDGTQVPISLVYRKGLRRGTNSPLFLQGYGSYGINYDARFSSVRLSLLERGFVCGLAHIRGGSEMGRLWYENGKFLKKKNTFTDFIACAEHLIEQGFTTPERLTISGGSAGGLLMGAVANMRPDLFHTVVAHVPFVDVVTTMLDESIPLTVIEYEEWGNPGNKTYYDYMKSYSPYDNVEAMDYPNMLITAGLNDPRVQYWEPAKWTARLRDLKTDDNALLLKTNMDAGHGGASGRYDRLREIAFEYAFILDRLGMSNVRAVRGTVASGH